MTYLQAPEHLLQVVVVGEGLDCDAVVLVRPDAVQPRQDVAPEAGLGGEVTVARVASGRVGRVVLK